MPEVHIQAQNYGCGCSACNDPFAEGGSGNSPNAGTSTGNSWIDGIGGNSWLDVGANSIISYTLANDFGFGWSTAERAAYIRATEAFEAVANITFVEFTSGTSDLRENIVDTATMIAETGGNWGGYHIFPTGSPPARGYYNTSRSYWDTTGLNDGGFGYELLLHELAHGLGLAHPHDSGMSSGIFPGVTSSGDTGTNGQNQTLWTIMSYNSYTNSSDNYGHSRTPMAYDIAAMQVHYGANTSTNTGNDTYVIPDSNSTGNAFYEAIWDSGGIDEMVYNGSLDTVIDLRSARLDGSVNGGGYLSSPVGIDGGYTIAGDFTNALANVNADFGVIIENAQGGSGDDTINGNSVDNDLIGGGGNDSITALNGDDDISGGDGNDSVNGGLGNDTIEGGAGADDLEGGGDDDIFDYRDGVVSNVQGSGENLDGGSGTDIVRVIASGAGATVFDFTGWNVENMEGIRFQASGGADINIVFSQKEFDQSGEFAADTHIDGFNGAGMTETITFNLNPTYGALDLSQWTFQDWGGQGELIEVNGTSTADTFTGSSQIDIMTPGAGNDSVDMGASDDTVVDMMENGNSTFAGGTGDDVLDFSGVSDNLVSDGSVVTNGTTGATAQISSFSTLMMGSGNDSVTESAEDIIELGAGNDTLFGNADIGIDTFDGGSGTDLFIERYAASNTYDLEAGTVNGNAILLDFEDLDAGSGNDTVAGTDAEGNRLDGGTGNDVIDGRGGDDSLLGDDGNDTITGGTGNDSVLAGTGQDSVLGGDGNDTLWGNGSNDTVIGNAGNDFLHGGDQNDLVQGGDGDDTVGGGNGADTVEGGAGNDEVNGGASADLLRGNDGNDTLLANTGEDTLFGGTGDDDVNGGDQNDTVYGNQGSDTVNGGFGNDAVYGGDDNDTVFGGFGNDGLFGGSGDDLQAAGAGTDTLYGNTGNDTLFGGDDNDLLYGNAGEDLLGGGNGADTLIGGEDSDRLIGDGGADVFRFLAVTDTAVGAGDVIADFAQGTDVIDVAAIDALVSTGADDAFTFLGTAAHTGAGATLRYSNVAGNTYIYGDVDADAAGDFVIVLEGTYTLAASDFVL